MNLACVRHPGYVRVLLDLSLVFQDLIVCWNADYLADVLREIRCERVDLLQLFHHVNHLFLITYYVQAYKLRILIDKPLNQLQIQWLLVGFIYKLLLREE